MDLCPECGNNSLLFILPTGYKCNDCGFVWNHGPIYSKTIMDNLKKQIEELKQEKQSLKLSIECLNNNITDKDKIIDDLKDKLESQDFNCKSKQKTINIQISIIEELKAKIQHFEKDTTRKSYGELDEIINQLSFDNKQKQKMIDELISQLNEYKNKKTKLMDLFCKKRGETDIEF